MRFRAVAQEPRKRLRLVPCRISSATRQGHNRRGASVDSWRRGALVAVSPTEVLLMLLLDAIRCIAASAAVPECAMSMLQPIRSIAAEAARLDAVLTADLIALALSVPLSTYFEAAHLGVAAGLLRARKLPGHGNRLVFQPTARAAGLAPALAPLSLRRTAPPDTLRRSLIRGGRPLRNSPRPVISDTRRGHRPVSSIWRADTRTRIGTCRPGWRAFSPVPTGHCRGWPPTSQGRGVRHHPAFFLTRIRVCHAAFHDVRTAR